jgi:hypothetical protein
VHLSVIVHSLFQLLIFCCAKIASYTLHLTFAPTLINCMPEVLKNNLEKSTARAKFEEGRMIVLKSGSAINKLQRTKVGPAYSHLQNLAIE